MIEIGLRNRSRNPSISSLPWNTTTSRNTRNRGLLTAEYSAFGAEDQQQQTDDTRHRATDQVPARALRVTAGDRFAGLLQQALPMYLTRGPQSASLDVG